MSSKSKRGARLEELEALRARLAPLSLTELQEFTRSEHALCPLSDVSRGVPGAGNPAASIMLVGEAAGENEERQGRPFVGSAGRKLDQLLEVAGLQRANIYITNVEKFHPPRNRNPYVVEKAACAPVLERELALVRPEVIVALGGVAAKQFFPTAQLAREHGKARIISYGGADYVFVPMYHPAAALYDGNLWAVLVEDFMRLRDEVKSAKALPSTPYYALLSDSSAFTNCTTTRIVGFDLETTSPKRGGKFAMYDAEIVGYSVAWADSVAAYVPGLPDLTSFVLESVQWEKITHQAKFEYGRLADIGVTLRNFHDTKIAAWLLQYHSTHLKSLARQLLSRDPVTYEQVTGGRDMLELEPGEIAEYAAADADNTRLIWPILRAELKRKGLYELYETVELPLVPVLYSMEKTGVLVDEKETLEVIAELEAAEQAALAAVYSAGLPGECSVDSHSQLASALEKMGAPEYGRTEAHDQLKTDEESLELMRDWNSALIDSILLYRKTGRMLDYARSYLALRYADGRLRPDFVQAGAGEEFSDESSSAPVTGRLACRNPNLQNQPHHGRGGRYAEFVAGWGARLRRCIIPTPGWLLISADIEQEEPRITALVADEKQMQRDFAAGIPIYAPMGEIIYGRPVSKADEHEWHVSKTFYLAKCYGSGASKLLEIDSTMSAEQARRANAAFDARYPGLQAYYERTKAELTEHGFVRDWFGRTRWIPKVYAGNPKDREAAYREAANFKIQAPAASVIKIALHHLHNALKSTQAHPLMTVHDEVVLECPPSELDKVAKMLYGMTVGVMPVELPVEVKVGKSWGEMRLYEGVPHSH